jgi:hypothetical protein
VDEAIEDLSVDSQRDEVARRKGDGGACHDLYREETVEKRGLAEAIAD